MPTIADTPSLTTTLTDLLSHLVRFPTVTSDQATNRAALDWVEQQLSDLPLHIQRFESHGFSSLVATTRQTKSPQLWLAGHIDVVPGPAAAFKPVVRSNRLYGRGAHDMKFALAIFIALLQELGDQLASYDLGLMITADEEVGGYDGVYHLLEHHGYRGQVVLLPDCNANWQLEMGSKGITWWDLTASGTTTHAGRTWEGDNAIDKLYRFINHVRTHITPEPCHDPLHQHPTLNLGTITGGTAANAVPDAATARIDIRFPPSSSITDVTGWIEAAEAAVPGVTAKAVIADPPYRVPDDGPIHVFERHTEAVTGHGVDKIIANGSSDARHFARYGLHSVNACPTGSGYHVPHEWIDLSDLAQFYEVTHRFVSELARR